MRSDLYLALSTYHLIVSVLASAGTLMAMQMVGCHWTLSYRNATLQWIQRFGLLCLAVALFCSGLRLPSQGDPIALLSAAAVNTAILIIIVPSALLGRAHLKSSGH